MKDNMTEEEVAHTMEVGRKVEEAARGEEGDAVDELDKALGAWQYIISHDTGPKPLSKGMRELIMRTIVLLWELKEARHGSSAFTPDEAAHIRIALRKHYGGNDQWCSVCDSILEKLKAPEGRPRC